MQRLLHHGTIIGAILLPMPAGSRGHPDAPERQVHGFPGPGQAWPSRLRDRPHRCARQCSIKVVYANGTSHASGLGSKYTNVVGKATWTWKVPQTTRTGKWPVTVTCQSGSRIGHVARSMTITA